MTTGELRDRVVIQSKTPSSDSQGGRSVSWGTFATVWANVRAAGAREQLAQQSIGSRAEYMVTIRYRADVTPSMRLSWTPYGGSALVLQILGIQPVDGRRDFMQMACGAVV